MDLPSPLITYYIGNYEDILSSIVVLMIVCFYTFIILLNPYREHRRRLPIVFTGVGALLLFVLLMWMPSPDLVKAMFNHP